MCIYKYVKMHEQQQVFCIRLIFKFVCVGVVRVFAVVSADAIAVAGVSVADAAVSLFYYYYCSFCCC